MTTAIAVAIVVGRALFAVIVLLTMVPFMIWLERKGAAYIQDRPGPNRAHVGPFRLWGLVHIVGDALKLMSKEAITPKGVEKFFYVLAPVLVAFVSLLTFAVVPWADTVRIGDWVVPMQVLPLNAGILWVLAISSLSVFGVVIAGWASNNKFSLLGGMRSSAQMLSYELPLALSLIGAMMVYGSLRLNDIVLGQGELLFGFLPKWGVFVQPLAFIIFTICLFAETNRNPFDMAESESELVAGYHTEYSAMKFGLFFMGEYIAMVTGAAVIATLFFGGWQIPFVSTEMIIANAGWLAPAVTLATAVGLFAFGGHQFKNYYTQPKIWGDSRDEEPMILGSIGLALGALLTVVGILLALADLPAFVGPILAASLQFGSFMAKTLFFCWLFVWVRWTLPRFRYDQVMAMGWKQLLPLALVNILLTGAVLLGVSLWL